MEVGDIIECYIPYEGRTSQAIIVKIITGPRGGRKAVVRPLGTPFSVSMSTLEKKAKKPC